MLEDDESMKKVSKMKKKAAKSYTKSELNKPIDSLCHPLFKTNEGFILVDGLLHGLVEQNPPITIKVNRQTGHSAFPARIAVLVTNVLRNLFKQLCEIHTLEHTSRSSARIIGLAFSYFNCSGC